MWKFWRVERSLDTTGMKEKEGCKRIRKKRAGKRVNPDDYTGKNKQQDKNGIKENKKIWLEWSRRR